MRISIASSKATATSKPRNDQSSAEGDLARAAATSAPKAPYTECPAIGSDTSCGVLVEITNTGFVVLSDPSQGPYDGDDDTLTGVINDSSHTVSSLTLSSDTDLFGFDGDGICSGTYGAWDGSTGCPYGSTGYEGPGTSFSNINSDASGGVVNFAGGISPGASDYFSLEEALTVNSVTAGGPSAKEQGSDPNESEHSSTCSTGLPVNCSTGDFWHAFTDYQLPGTGSGLTLTRTYDSANASVDGPLGYGWTDSFNMSLALDASGDVTVHQEDGSTVSFSPDGYGDYVAPPRVLARLVENQDGSYTFTRDATQLSYNFSAAGQLQNIVDLNGNITTLSYTGNNLTTIAAPDGRALTLNYSDSHIASIDDPLGRSETFVYGATGNLDSVTNPLGHVTKFTYGGSHRMLTMKMPSGGKLTNTYNSAGQVTKQVDPAGLTTTWSYAGDNASPAGGVTTLTDPHGNVTEYDYTNLELMAVVHAAGTPSAATTSYAYDPATLGVSAVTDPAGNMTTNTYDGEGNKTSTVDALNNTTKYYYNSLNELTGVFSPLGESTSTDYDSQGNRLDSIDATGGETAYAYSDPAHPGSATSVTDPDGRVTTLTYDAAGDVATSSVSPNSATTDTTAYGYDGDGERTCVVSANANAVGANCPNGGVAPASGVSTITYNAIGETTATTDGDGHTTSYSYNANGDQTKVTDPDGHTTVTDYDHDDRITSVATGTDSDSQSKTVYAYDLAPGSGLCSGESAATYCTTTTDALGHTTVDFYNALGELIQYTRPGGHSTAYTYDLAGNTQTSTDSENQVTSYGYDAVNRLTSISYTQGVIPNVSYAYNADGERTTMTDSTGTTTYTYDGDGRLTSRQDGAGNTVKYTYDGAGDMTGLTYPNGKTVQRTYDGADRMSSVTDWNDDTTHFGYNADGDLTKTLYPNGDDVDSAYDGAQELSSTDAVTDSTGAVLAGLADTRNADGQLTKEADSGALAGSTNYGYDAQSQLIKAGTGEYAYDHSGNPTKVGSDDQIFNSSNELTSSTDGSTRLTYTYDANGARLTSSGGATYTYDQAGQLMSATEAAPMPESRPAVSSVHPSVGPTAGGTTVTIKGSNFAKASRVLFGARPAKRFTVLAHSIRAVSPRGAGQVNLRVSGPGGSSRLTEHDRFTYQSPKPQITDLAPNHGAAKGDTKVRIHGQHFARAVKVRFGSKAARFHFASSRLLIATAPAGHGAVYVTVRTPQGTSATGRASKFRYRAAKKRRRHRAVQRKSRSNLAAGQTPSVTSFTYDGDGLRATETTDELTIDFAWDVTTAVPSLLDDGTYSYIYGPEGTAVEQISDSESSTQYFFADGVGSTRALLGNDGSIDSTYTYDPYGNLTRTTGTSTTPIQFAGGYRDSSTGLYYLVHRYYDPATAQFISVDPAESVSGAAYSYAGDSPTNASDPSGLLEYGSCASGTANGHLGIGVTGAVEICSWTGDFAATTIELSAGGGAGLGAGASGGVSAVVDLSASSPEDLGGLCGAIGVSGSVLAGADVSIDCTGGAEAGVTTGPDVHISGDLTGSYTWVVSSSTGYHSKLPGSVSAAYNHFSNTLPSLGAATIGTGDGPQCVATLHPSSGGGIPLSEPTLTGIPLV